MPSMKQISLLAATTPSNPLPPADGVAGCGADEEDGNVWVMCGSREATYTSVSKVHWSGVITGVGRSKTGPVAACSRRRKYSCHRKVRQIRETKRPPENAGFRLLADRVWHCLLSADKSYV